VRKLIVQVAALLLITGVAYLGLFQRQAVMGLFKQARLNAKGYTPAKTPEEALDRFRDAVKDRDYEAAASYCGGDFVEQINKAAPGAKVLGDAIDNLLHNMDQEGIKSDRVKLVLRLIEPFPRHLKVVDIKKRGEDQAYAVLVEESGAPLKVDGRFEDWRIDGRLMRSLARGIPSLVEVRRVGEGDKAQWKIFFPVTPEQRDCVTYLAENASNYARSLDKVKYAIKRDAATKSDLERELRVELEEAGK